MDRVLTDKADYTNLVSCLVTTDKESCRVEGQYSAMSCPVLSG